MLQEAKAPLDLGTKSATMESHNQPEKIVTHVGVKHHPYTIVEDDQDVFEICEYLCTQTLLAIDTETYSNGKRGPKMYDTEVRLQFSDPFINAVRLIQIRSRESESFIFDIRKLSESGLEILKNLLEQPEITWVGHNLKFDYKMLAVNFDVHLNKVYDTFIAAQCLGFATGDQAAVARGYGLKDILRDYLGVYIDKTEQSSNWSARELSDSQLQYAADDLLYLFDLYDCFTEAIEKEYGMHKGVQLEMDVLPVICRMELHGLALDERMFNLVQQSAAQLLPELEEQVCRYIGWPMMPTPPLVRLKTKRTMMAKPINFDGKSGSPLMSNPTMLKAFKEKGIALENLQGDYLEDVAKNAGHEILKKFVFYRDLTKQLSLTYSDWVNPQTNRLHPTFNQCGASTGRFSCSNPNLQQVPKLDVEVPKAIYEANKDILEPYFDEKKGKCFLNYRYCFIAVEGNKFLSSDYSGQEVRVMVALSKDPELIRIHHEPSVVERNGEMVKNMAADVHAKTAELMWGKSHGVTCWNAKSMDFPGLPGKKFRDIAKVIVFGLCGHEDTLVATSRGWRRIKELNVDDQVIAESGLLRRVDSVVCKGLKDTLKVTLEGGYQIEFTPDHPVRVLESNGNMTWKKLAKVEKSDRLVLRPDTSCSTDESFVDEQGKSVEWSIFAIKKLARNTTDRIPYVIFQAPKKYQFAFVKALLIMAKDVKFYNRKITFTSEQENIAVDLQRLLLAIGILSERSGNVLKFSLVSQEVIFDFKRIVSVEESKAVVYDIGVDDEHCFLANGVVVHNCYGKSAAGLALDWGVTQEEAQAIIDEFFRAYPVLKRWLESKGREANDTRMSWYGSKEKGVIRWRMVNSGRHADGGALKRAGQNTPIQATSALMMKMALVILDRRLKGTQVKMIGTVHDELMVEVPEAQVEEFSEVIRDGMNEAGNFFLSGVIPSSCGIGVSSHWSKD